MTQSLTSPGDFMHCKLLSLSLAALLVAPLPAIAQCPNWLPGPFDDGTPLSANGVIHAMTSWDPDGGGPLAARLVVGGNFTTINGVTARNIAQRDPATGAWSQIGIGVTSTVYAAIAFNGELVIGLDGDNDLGTFDETVRRWNGSTWVSLSATNTGSVYALAEWNGSLYVGGTFLTHFTTGDSGPAHFVARWNPGSGEYDIAGANPFGNFETGTGVRAMVVHNGELFLGGHTQGTTGQQAATLGRIDAAGQYAEFTAGSDLGGIYALASYAGQVIVGGGFLTLNGITVHDVASWNGSNFSAMDSGVNGTVWDITLHQGLVISGAFNTAGSVSASRVAFMAPGGSTWQTLGGGANNTVYDVESYGGQLVAGGAFTAAEQPADRVAHWDGVAWSPFLGGAGFYVLAMTSYAGRLVAGGDFHQATTGMSTANNIAGWNGQSLTPFGTGMNGGIYSLKAFKYPGFTGDNELIAGGAFTTAGGVAANNIARWDEDPVSGFPPPAWQAMGAGFNNAVLAVERFGSATYAAGYFTGSGATAVSRIARWNETSDVWEPLGSGLNGLVYALKEYNGFLYVGGNFSTANGIAAQGLARWNGSSWSAVPGAFFDVVFALESHSAQLAIGGQFSSVSGSPNVCLFDGTNFIGLPGGCNSNVRALKSLNGNLHVAGDFTTAGGVPMQHFAVWNGAWQDPQFGADAAIYALGAFNIEVHAGGPFANVDFGGGDPSIHSPFWGRYNTTGGQPWFRSQPFNVTAAIGTNASFTADVAVGYAGLSHRWYHNGVALNDGATGNGSTISGATALTLTITGVAPPDLGEYQLRASGPCGTVSSAIATLNTSTTGVDDAPTPGRTLFHSLGPNPARGGTQLRFSLAAESHVGVRVFDIGGRLVRRVDLGRLPGGAHVLGLDASDGEGRRLAPANYVVRLEADGHTVGTRTLTFIR